MICKQIFALICVFAVCFHAGSGNVFDIVERWPFIGCSVLDVVLYFACLSFCFQVVSMQLLLVSHDVLGAA